MLPVGRWVHNINKYLHTLLQLDHFKNDFDILTYKLFTASDNQKRIRVFFSNFNDFFVKTILKEEVVKIFVFCVLHPVNSLLFRLSYQ